MRYHIITARKTTQEIIGGIDMKSYEMVETLSEKANVTLEQAKNALEKSNWDMLDAAIYLERNRSSGDSRQNPPRQGYQYVSSQMNEAGGQFRQPPYPPYPQQGFNPPPRGHYPPNYPPYPGGQPGFNPPPQGDPRYNGVPPYGYPRSRSRRKSVDDFLNRAGDRAERVIGDGVTNSFVIRSKGTKILQIPILLFIILLFAAWYVVVPILVIGLFCGLKYSFEGKELDNFSINNVMNTTSNVAEKIKDDIKNAAVDLTKDSTPAANDGSSAEDKPAGIDITKQ